MTDPRSFTMVQALVAGDDPPLELGDLVERPGWMADAACREHPEVSWFPARGESTDPAKAVCAGCLVLGECREYIAAMAGPVSLHGIWGGLSGRDRIRRRRVNAA